MNAPYIPELDIKYPEQPDGHMVEVIELRNVVVDENYPFLDKSFRFKFFRFLVYLGINTAAYWLSVLRYGLKIKGRENLRKHRKIFKDGAMTVCNHVHRWDFIFTARAVRYHGIYFPAWKEHFKGPDSGSIIHAGGIPVPDDISTMKCFNRAFDEFHRRKKWMHAYPESTRFDYFVPIRPFKKGVFSMAHRYNLPVIPAAISYRKPHFPYTLLNKYRVKKGGQNLPLVTLSLGEPILFDKTLDRKAAITKMRKECHEAVVRLAGITDNPYPAEGD